MTGAGSLPQISKAGTAAGKRFGCSALVPSREAGLAVTYSGGPSCAAGGPPHAAWRRCVAVVAPARPRPGGVTVELDVETLTITHGLEVDGVMMA